MHVFYLFAITWQGLNKILMFGRDTFQILSLTIPLKQDSPLHYLQNHK